MLKQVWCSAWKVQRSILELGYLRNALTIAKIRISKNEIRNNIKIQMFEIQNNCCLVVFLSVLALRFLSFEFVCGLRPDTK
jgi:hypothetical protein